MVPESRKAFQHRKQDPLRISLKKELNKFNKLNLQRLQSESEKDQKGENNYDLFSAGRAAVQSQANLLNARVRLNAFGLAFAF